MHWLPHSCVDEGQEHAWFTQTRPPVHSLSVQHAAVGMHCDPHGLKPLAHTHTLPVQLSPAPQLPHCIVPPQPSDAVPHVAPTASHVFVVQPQWFGVPPPPHVSGGAHAPQSSIPVHPSDTSPQLMPRSAQVLGVHAVEPHMFGCSPPQCWPAGQPPQSTTLPHPSGAVPHCAPSSTHVLARHPHWLSSPPPPHTHGTGQSPHVSTSSQPSEIAPHCAPSDRHVFAAQGFVPHRFGPSPPQNWPCGHTPQDTTPPHPSGAFPHSAASPKHVAGAHAPVSAPASVDGFGGKADVSPCSPAHATTSNIGSSAAYLVGMMLIMRGGHERRNRSFPPGHAILDALATAVDE